MTKTVRVWQGRPLNDWFTPADWSPQGVPQPGDQAVIDTPQGGPSIGPTDPVVDGVSVALGAVGFGSSNGLNVLGGTLGSAVQITVSDAAPYGALNLDATTGGRASTFDGTALASNGNLTVNSDGTVEGSGTFEVARGGTAAFAADVANTGTLRFLDDNGTLLLQKPESLGAPITNLQAGDRIQFATGLATGATLDHGILTIFGQNGIVLQTLSVETAGPLTFYAQPFAHQGSVLTTSQATRGWGGGSGDWFDAANWTNGIPLGGDTVTITGGTAILSAADAAQFGAVDFEHVFLGAAGSQAPVTLQATDETFGSGVVLDALGTPLYTPGDYVAPQDTFAADGITRFLGTLEANAQGGTLTLAIGSDGSSANFIVVGEPKMDGFRASILDTQESRLDVTGGTLTNNGLVQIDGYADFAAGTTIAGNGSIVLQAGGSALIAGAVGSAQTVAFGDSRGTLLLSDLPQFGGLVTLAQAGDRIDFTHVVAQSASFDANTDTLTLLGASGQSVGQLALADPNTNGPSSADFTLSSDGGQGTMLTYTPQGAATLEESLPVGAVGTTDQQIPLSQLLVEAFGTIPAAYTSFILSGHYEPFPTESYWQQGSVAPTNSEWYFDGQPVKQSITVSAADIGNVSLFEGNSIIRTAWFQVQTASTAAGAPAEFVRYNIWTVNPATDAPPTAYSTPVAGVAGSASRFGRVDPSDIVASAYHYNTTYPATLNYNNCNWIADNVAAGAGAVMPYENYSPDPTLNQSGGFWRIAYRGTDTPNPVVDWFSLVRPGDVVRMMRIGQTGAHTTTVVGVVNPDGGLTVYDNGDRNSSGQNIIGPHDATYWSGTDPASITIYRLDPNHQYLIQGTTLGEFLQGSVFDNLIQPGGGSDTITAGAALNEIQDSTTHLNGIRVTDFHLGDTLDFTDLNPAGGSVAFDAGSGTLMVSSGGQVVARLALPGSYSGQSFFTSADGQGGMVVTLAPVDLAGYGAAAQTTLASAFAPLAAAGHGTNLIASANGSDAPPPVAGQFNILRITDPVAGSTIAVPDGYPAATGRASYQGAFLQGSSDVTLMSPDRGSALMVGNQGNDVLIGRGAGDTLVGGSGSDALFGGSDGSLLVAGPGQDTLVGVAGASTLIGGSGAALIAAGTGHASIVAGSGDTILAGGAAATVAANGDALAYGGSGTLLFLNGAGSSTVVGGTGTGPDVIDGGAGGGLYAGGSGGDNLILAGQGATTMFGAGSGDVLFAAGAGPDTLIAGGGNETLSGLGSSGGNVFFAGPGDDIIGGGAGAATVFGGTGSAIVVGTGGADSYAFARGLFAGGTMAIEGFAPGKGDQVLLQGYAPGEVANDLARAVVTGGNTALTLSDGTALLFVGVTDLSSAAFAQV